MDSPSAPGAPLTFRSLPDELSSQAKAVLRSLRKVDPDGAGKLLSDSDARLGVFLRGVLGALEDREGQYGSTLEEDISMREREGDGGRKGKALVVRIGEKTLLREAKRWVKEKLEATGQVDGRAAKRQKVGR